MARSDSSRLQAYYMEESAWGVIPSSALQAWRVTGVDVGGEKETTESEELREDRQVPDIIEVGQGAVHSFPVEWSYLTHDVWLAHLLKNAWSSPVTVTGSTDIDFAAAGKTITQVGASFNTQFKLGQVIRVKGTTSNGSNGTPKYFTIAALAATVITVVETVVDEASTSAVLHSGGMLRNWIDGTAGGGAVDPSMVVEVKPADLTNIFHYAVGMKVNTLELNLATRAKIVGTFTGMGREWTPSATTSGTGAPTAATTNPIINSTANVATLMEGGSALATAVKSLRLSITNNIRRQGAIASKFDIGEGLGTLGITGTIDPYFEDNALATKFKNHTPTSIRFDLQDSLGNRQIWTFPRVAYAGGRVGPQAQGRNQDTNLPMPIAAYMDPTWKFSAQVCRFAA